MVPGDGVLVTLLLGPDFPSIECVDEQPPPILREFGLIGEGMECADLC